MDITKKQIIKTAILPGIIPRFKSLVQSNSGTLAYLIALVFQTVRILPNNHPYLAPSATGQYTIRQAILEASNHIIFSRKNIDQIIIFFSIIVSFYWKIWKSQILNKKSFLKVEILLS